MRLGLAAAALLGLACATTPRPPGGPPEAAEAPGEAGTPPEAAAGLLEAASAAPEGVPGPVPAPPPPPRAAPAAGRGVEVYPPARTGMESRPSLPVRMAAPGGTGVSPPSPAAPPPVSADSTVASVVLDTPAGRVEVRCPPCPGCGTDAGDDGKEHLHDLLMEVAKPAAGAVGGAIAALLVAKRRRKRG